VQIVRCCSFHGSKRFFRAGLRHSFLRREVANEWPVDWPVVTEKGPDTLKLDQLGANTILALLK
jgi:hypothetical protein